jgi:membrane protease YdiL (CAAX protease family)
MTNDRLRIWEASAIFIGFTTYFYLLLFTLLPFLKSRISINPAAYWFATGYFLFIPLLLFAVAAVKREGHSQWSEVAEALGIRKFSKHDWIYSVGGLLLVFACTGVIFGVSFLLNKQWGVRPLSTTPWFMEMHPFKGSERLLLLVWLPMFFFNIVGEELLWRGYIQTRLEARNGWLICSLLWMVFHLPFGMDLMIMLIPIVLIVPYVYLKTGNALTGVFIHGIYNGPIFVMISLGFMD